MCSGAGARDRGGAGSWKNKFWSRSYLKPGRLQNPRRRSQNMVQSHSRHSNNKCKKRAYNHTVGGGGAPGEEVPERNNTQSKFLRR